MPMEISQLLSSLFVFGLQKSTERINRGDDDNHQRDHDAPLAAPRAHPRSAQGHTATRLSNPSVPRARLEASSLMRCASRRQLAPRRTVPGRGHLRRIMRASPHSQRHVAQRDGPTAPLAEPGVHAEQYSGRDDRREHLPWCGVKGKGTGCAGAGAARVRGAVEDEGEDQGEG